MEPCDSQIAYLLPLGKEKWLALALDADFCNSGWSLEKRKEEVVDTLSYYCTGLTGVLEHTDAKERI